MFSKPKIIRTATVAMSLNYLLKGQLAFLKKHYEVVAVSGQDHHLETVAKREEVRTIALSMQRPMSPIKDLLSLWKLYRLFKKEKPQIVHSITPKAGLLSMLAAYFAGVPIRIHTFTGLIFPSKTGLLQKILVVMDKLLCFCATHIYPEGEGVKQDLVSYKITNKPLKVIANGNVNGIDTSYFSPEQITEQQKATLKNELNIEENDFVFIFVGRLVGDKGINELVSAFTKLNSPFFGRELCPEIREAGGEAKLLLVGPFETDLDALLPETLKEIKENPHIISVGFQNDVRPYFAISNALVFPSYREGFPNVVLQAGAMGLPCIVSNINGCNEIIIDGENGIIIPVKNSDAIYESMVQLITNTAFRSQLQCNARRLIVSRYEQQLVWEAILAEYKSLQKYV